MMELTFIDVWMFFFSVVEDLFKSREPVPEMKAIYFMSPTAKVFVLFNNVEKKSL